MHIHFNVNLWSLRRNHVWPRWHNLNTVVEKALVMLYSKYKRSGLFSFLQELNKKYFYFFLNKIVDAEFQKVRLVFQIKMK